MERQYLVLEVHDASKRLLHWEVGPSVALRPRALRGRVAAHQQTRWQSPLTAVAAEMHLTQLLRRHAVEKAELVAVHS